MSVLEELQDTFREHFGDDTIMLSRGTKAADIDGWDSLSHVTLILAVEKAFKVRFNSTEIAGLENVGALIDLIEARTKPA